MLFVQGLMLHYRSKRRGFTTYTAGQLKAVATTYFKTEMGIEVKESEIKFDTVHVSFQVGQMIIYEIPSAMEVAWHSKVVDEWTGTYF